MRALLTPLFLAMILLAVPAHAEVPRDNTLSPDEVQSGWRLLFDGKSLEHWRSYQEGSAGSQWQVVDGTLHLSAAGGGDLITRAQYTNFELSLDWLISQGGNSGIFILADESQKRIFFNAPEIQILDDARHPDGKLETHRSGSLYDMIASPPQSQLEAGVWNRTRIRLVDQRLSIWHNGLQVTDIRIGSEQWQSLVDASKFRNWAGFGRNPGGHIGLQDHGNPVSFKNIRILNLEPEEFSE